MDHLFINDIVNYMSDEDDVFEPVPLPRAPRLFRDRVDLYNLLSEQQFFVRFRLKKRTVEILLELIREEIETRTPRNQAIPPMTRLLIALRYYATGSFAICCGDFAHVSKTVAWNVINEVTFAIAHLRPQFIKMPTTPEEQHETRVKFYAKFKFPKVIGVIDCTHVRIQSPGGEFAEAYRNRKGWFSKNLQVVAGPDLEILDIVARWQGSTHDQTIFNASSLRRRFENGEFGFNFIIGDGGYEILPYLLIPLPNPTTEAENLYNQALIRTRNLVERLFGVWKRRFPILSTGIRVARHNLVKADAVIVACAVLYNLACREREEIPPADEMLNLIIYEDNFDAEAAVNDAGNARDAVRARLIDEWFFPLLPPVVPPVVPPIVPPVVAPEEDTEEEEE